MIDKFETPILVTKPVIPSKKDLIDAFSEVIDSGWLTNMGKQHELFEQKLCEYLNVDNILVFNNGTIALITALKALDLPKGSEVITTPFTFSATPHSIAWNGLTPVFADIDEKTMTLSPEAIERAITPNSSAILPVHVYGFPCDVEAIEKIAKKHNLKVIYDAAHAFSTEINGKSICEWGDITMLSFHSTKLFNSIEGGALVFNDKNLSDKIYELRNFGIKKFKNKEEEKEGIKSKDLINDIGINGKLNELQAAWGLQTLPLVKPEQDRRKLIADQYKKELDSENWIKIPQMPNGVSNSMQYFPILCQNNTRDALYDELLKYNVYPRKYFYPLCSDYGCYNELPSSNKDNLKISNIIANSVLCLPFYGELAENNYEKIKKICRIIKMVR
jgi:dTDP-4-amino-4,6-dideoxygalactose transaminase